MQRIDLPPRRREPGSDLVAIGGEAGVAGRLRRQRQPQIEGIDPL